MEGKLQSQDVSKFVFAGNATITLVSKRTGMRFTFKVREREGRNGDPLHYVRLLSGPNNETDYTFLGTVFNRKAYIPSRKSSVTSDAPAQKAVAWLMANIEQEQVLEEGVEVWHEGKCGRCGRTLTVPASIERGIGPECAGIMGV